MKTSVSASEAAKILDCAASYIYQLIQAGRIHHEWKRGRVLVIPDKDGSIPIKDPGTYL